MDVSLPESRAMFGLERLKDTLSSLPSRIGRRHVDSSVTSAGRGLLSVDGIRSARLARRMLLKSMLADRKFLTEGWGSAVQKVRLFQDGEFSQSGA